VSNWYKFFFVILFQWNRLKMSKQYSFNSIDDPLALFDKIYDKPWTRLGPYFVGMSIGWMLFKTECKIKMNTVSAPAAFVSIFGLKTISHLLFNISSLPWLLDGLFRRRCSAVWYLVSIKWIYIRSRPPRTLRWVTLCGPFAYRGQWSLAPPDTEVSHPQIPTHTHSS